MPAKKRRKEIRLRDFRFNKCYNIHIFKLRNITRTNKWSSAIEFAFFGSFSFILLFPMFALHRKPFSFFNFCCCCCSLFALLILLSRFRYMDLRSLGKFIRRTVWRREIDVNSSCLMLQCVWLCVCIIFLHNWTYERLIYNIYFVSIIITIAPISPAYMYLTFHFRIVDTRHALIQYSWLLIVLFVFQFSLSFILHSVFVYSFERLRMPFSVPFHFMFFPIPFHLSNTLKVDKWTPSMQKGNNLKWNIS